MEAKTLASDEVAAPEAPAPAPVEEKERPPDTTGHPLIQALQYPDRRLRFAAANCLARIGFPPAHPAYRRLLPVLVDGARQKAAVVSLVISNDPRMRDRFATLLAGEGLQAMTAMGGRDGFSLAIQYPPKDCLLLDSDLSEFQRLHQRLAMRKLVSASPLPLIIISSRNRASGIMEQFQAERYKAVLRTEVSPEDARLYEDLRMIQRLERQKQAVAVLTNESRDARRRLKETLLIEAERRGRPQRQNELLQMMHEQSLLGDGAGIRGALINIFLAEELSGYTAMRTLQRLRADPRTRHVPVALLAGSRRKNQVADEFAEFLGEGGNVRILEYEIDRKDLFAEAMAMTAANPLSKRNYARNENAAIALRSSEALATLDFGGAGIRLKKEEADTLRDVLSDPSREVALREAVARTLGHFGASAAAPTLAKVFREEAREHVQLRAACMAALGRVDPQNEYRELKTKALDEEERLIRDAAARALAIAGDGETLRPDILRSQRVNDPLALLEAADEPLPEVPAPGEAAAPAGEGEAAPAAEEGFGEAAQEEPVAAEEVVGDADAGWGGETDEGEAKDDGEDAIEELW